MGLLKGKVQLNDQTASDFVPVLCFAAAGMGAYWLPERVRAPLCVKLNSLGLGACTCGIRLIPSKSVWGVVAVVTEKGQVMCLC